MLQIFVVKIRIKTPKRKRYRFIIQAPSSIHAITKAIESLPIDEQDLPDTEYIAEIFQANDLQTGQLDLFSG